MSSSRPSLFERLGLRPDLDPRVLSDIKTQRKSIIAGLLCTAGASVLYTATIGLSKVVLNAISDLKAAKDLDAAARAVAVDHSVNLLYACALGTVAIFGVRYFLVRGQLYMLAKASNRLAAELRIRLLSKLLRLPVSYFNDRRSGAIQSVLSNDVNVYQSAIGVIRDSIDAPIKAIGAFVVVLFLQPLVALCAMPLIYVMSRVINLNSKRMRAAQAQVQDDLADLSATTNEVLQGTRVVKAFGVEARTEAEYGRLIETSFKSQMRAANQFAKLRPMVDLLGAFALAVMLIGATYLVQHGKLDVGTIAALAFASDVINQGFRGLAGMRNTVAQVEAAAKRIYREVLDIPEGEPSALAGTRRIESPKGRIEFSKVSFAYPDGTEALKEVSFTVEPDTSLAIVGPSGAGKSTIADLILRFYEPTSGQILLDGVNIAELDPAFLRSLIGVVPQHTFLFAGSIEENVRIGRPEATGAELYEALNAAHATEFVAEMAGRTTSELGERGIRLSGGQMQRVAIARALVRKPTVLLLDEATSALDASSEQAVTEALDEIMKQRTTVMIAHRLTTAARANRILYLRAGRVIEEGSHTELMRRDGEYAALFRLFSGGVLEGGGFG
ncbi:MAG TPA: ABC transporter ATP-binding protein [Fimbriimonadaceae bacterium]|nr:ABC transporter ATP-binding protein [Fimbriimonadaceae bacterium]